MCSEKKNRENSFTIKAIFFRPSSVDEKIRITRITTTMMMYALATVAYVCRKVLRFRPELSRTGCFLAPMKWVVICICLLTLRRPFRWSFFRTLDDTTDDVMEAPGAQSWITLTVVRMKRDSWKGRWKKSCFDKLLLIFGLYGGRLGSSSSQRYDLKRHSSEATRRKLWSAMK